jgi:hypothetical protein
VVKQLAIDLSDLGSRFEDATGVADHFLDLETGLVIQVDEEILWELEELYQDGGGQQPESPSEMGALLRARGIHGSRARALLRADQVERGLGDRYLKLPRKGSRAGYPDMEAFLHTVEDERLRGRLQRASTGRRAFSRFKAVLRSDEDARQRWFAFRNHCLAQRAIEWLETEGIESVPVRVSVPERKRVPAS